MAVLDPTDPDGGAAVEALRRRFRAFVVPHPGDPPTLETGLPAIPVATSDGIAHANTEADARARDHGRTRRLWREAVGQGVRGAGLRPVVRLASAVPSLPSVSVRVQPRYTRVVARVGDVTGLAGLASAGSAMWLGLGTAAGVVLGGVGLALVAVGGGVTAVDVHRRRRRARVLGPDGLAAEAAALAVLDALRQSSLVIDPSAVVRTERVSERLEVWLDSRVADDAEVFGQSIGDLLARVESPRYLVRIGTGALLAVPEVLGVRKRRATAFLEAWREHVGPAELVFTQTPSGRRALASARARAVGQPERVERVRRWSTRPGR